MNGALRFLVIACVLIGIWGIVVDLVGWLIEQALVVYP